MSTDTMPAVVSGWALRAQSTWFPGSGVSSVSSLPSGYPYSDTNYISDPSGNNKYTAMIAVTIPSDSSISSVSKLSISFYAKDRNSTAGTIYGSLRTVSQSNGSSSSDTASTFREKAIGSEASISGIGTSSSLKTMSFSGSFSKGTTYYLFIYTKSTNDIYALDYRAGKFSAEITYEAIQYSIKYNANGGVGAPSTQYKGYDSIATISSVKPTRVDDSGGSYVVTMNTNGGISDYNSLSADITISYSFTHWNTKADGSGTSYTPGSTYAGNSNLLLYAIYSSTTKTKQVTLPTPVKNGYSFIGWTDDPESHSGFTGNIIPTKDITLYAIWDPLGFIYISNGDSFDAYQIYVYDGDGWDLYCPFVYDGDTWSMCS